jgi:hypothetical protein
LTFVVQGFFAQRKGTFISFIVKSLCRGLKKIKQPGTLEIPYTAHRKLPKKAPTHWVFSTLAAMFGNGATIGTIKKSTNQNMPAQLQAKNEASGVAPGTTTPGIAESPTAAADSLIFGTEALGFGW